MGIFNKKTRAKKLTNLAELEPMLESGKPVLVDLMQQNCGPCRTMDGIVNELAEEYGESVHIVKVDVTKVAGAAQMFKVRSTPTFILLGRPQKKMSKKARRRAGNEAAPAKKSAVQPRWRTTGLVRKDQLQRVLESNGATPPG